MRRRNASWPIAMGGALAAVVLGRAVVIRRSQLDLRGRVVLITGGSRGLGLALARAFAHEGARLALCARDAERLAWARDEIAGLGAEVLAVPCDVRDADQVRALVRTVADRFGQVDVLINNAAIFVVGPFTDTTPQDFEESMATIFWGAFHAIEAVLPGMRARQSGTIINITSVGGKVSVPHIAPYCTAKFALVALSEGLRAELGRDGITVTTIAPGLMRTGSIVNAWFKGQHDKEYTMASLMGNLPIMSMSARRAAKRIVRATRRGESEVVLGQQAKALSLLHGIATGTSVDVLRALARLMPAPGGIGRDRARGYQSETSVTRSFLNALGRRDALEYHQFPPAQPGVMASGSSARDTAGVP